MPTPEQKSYEAHKAALAENAKNSAHPMAGTIVDEFLALKLSGQHAAAEALAITVATDLNTELATWRQQATEELSAVEAALNEQPGGEA